ncbi:hypothetical protein AB0M47_26050 [Hamadaea sp. NPDC051192]|uniref:5'-methylthioadenosine/S-adenosylhomocysteine nucleosidase family protein n=1 Tax=Hamadaea sp. NPDC051192 TaxID=3154940 RepID=UPI00341279AA
MNAGAVTFGDHSPAFGSLREEPVESVPTMKQPVRDKSRALLVVAADVERDATIKAITEHTGAALGRVYLEHHTVYELGQISRTDVTLAHVAQGTVTPDSAGPAAQELIDKIKPDFLILEGICYGLKDDDARSPQRLGDVLVANEIKLIAHQKISGRLVDRGGAVHPSATLLDRFRSASLDWAGPATVHIGPMVSESVLVNSAAYRAQIKKRYPEAIGGEMEAAGIYAAAIRGRVEWCVVKACCDWGFNKTDEAQRTAADNAASFVAHMIKIGGLDPVTRR